MVSLIWTEIAIEDLRLIHGYISIDSKVYVERFIGKIINHEDQLKKFPKSGRVVPEFDSGIIIKLIEGTFSIVNKINSDNRIEPGVVREYISLQPNNLPKKNKTAKAQNLIFSLTCVNLI